MKKNFTIWIIVISVVIVLIAFGIIVGNLLTNKKENNNAGNNETINNEQQVSQNNDTEPQNIELNSKIGTQIIDKLSIPNVYSIMIANELDKSGVSDKYKRMFAFSKITWDDTYATMIRESEEYTGKYVTSEDLTKVVKEYFDNANIKHGEIIGDQSYDSTKKNYIIVPMGFAGSDFDYIVEVPYEIKEYKDKVEAYAYRLYITRSLEATETEEKAYDNIYYDKDKKNIAIKSTSQDMYDENFQKDYLKQKIDSLEINKTKLQKVKYDFSKKDNNYYLLDFELVK